LDQIVFDDPEISFHRHQMLDALPLPHDAVLEWGMMGYGNDDSSWVDDETPAEAAVWDPKRWCSFSEMYSDVCASLAAKEAALRGKEAFEMPGWGASVDIRTDRYALWIAKDCWRQDTSVGIVPGAPESLCAAFVYHYGGQALAGYEAYSSWEMDPANPPSSPTAYFIDDETPYEPVFSPVPPESPDGMGGVEGKEEGAELSELSERLSHMNMIALVEEGREDVLPPAPPEPPDKPDGGLTRVLRTEPGVERTTLGEEVCWEDGDWENEEWVDELERSHMKQREWNEAQQTWTEASETWQTVVAVVREADRVDREGGGSVEPCTPTEVRNETVEQPSGTRMDPDGGAIPQQKPEAELLTVQARQLPEQAKLSVMDAKVAPPYPAYGKDHLEVVPGEQSAPVVGEEPVLGGALGDGGLGSGATTILVPSLVDKASPSATRDEIADLKLHLMDVADINVKPGVIRAGRRRREGTVVQHRPYSPPVDSVSEARTVLHLAPRRPPDMEEATEAVRPATAVVDEYERVSLDPATGQTFCSAYMHGYALPQDLMDRFDKENVETLRHKTACTIADIRKRSHECKVFPDVGAGPSIIGRHIVDAMRLKVHDWAGEGRLRAANGSVLREDGIVHVPIMLDNLHLVRHTCRVVPAFTEGIILGNDFLKPHEAVVDFRRDLVTIKGAEEPVNFFCRTHPWGIVRTIEDLLVPAGASVRVLARVGPRMSPWFTPDMDVWVEPNKHLPLERGVAVAKSLGTVDEHKTVVVEVCNPHEADSMLSAGTNVGKLEKPNIQEDARLAVLDMEEVRSHAAAGGTVSPVFMLKPDDPAATVIPPGLDLVEAGATKDTSFENLVEDEEDLAPPPVHEHVRLERGSTSGASGANLFGAGAVNPALMQNWAPSGMTLKLTIGPGLLGGAPPRSRQRRDRRRSSEDRPAASSGTSAPAAVASRHSVVRTILDADFEPLGVIDECEGEAQ
jgi:hypothetical protein